MANCHSSSVLYLQCCCSITTHKMTQTKSRSQSMNVPKEEAVLEMFTTRAETTCLPPGVCEFMAVSHTVGTAELCRSPTDRMNLIFC